MRFHRTCVAAVFGAAALATVASRAEAEELAPCAGIVDSSNVVACAVRASLAARSEREGVAAAEARRTAASPWLPSNPVVTISGGPAFPNALANPVGAPSWYVALGQEIEIGGQRSARRDAADAEATAQRRRVVVSERDAAARALELLYLAIAGDREVALLRRVEDAGTKGAAAARARAAQGVASAIDADVAAASAARLEVERIDAEARLRAAKSELASLLGRDPAAPLDVRADLEPLPSAARATTGLAERASSQRPDVLALGDEARAYGLRAEAFRRSRWPNPTVSLFAQNDVFDGKTIGIGISIPIPLPAPVGRTYKGEIAEAEALGRRAAVERDRAARGVKLEVANAVTAYESRRAQLAAISGDALDRARKGIDDLASEIEAGRVSVRDAIVTQQSLRDLLRAEIVARRELCLASVAVARATGVSLEGGAR